MALASMLAIFSVASYLALAGLGEYQSDMYALRRHESAARAALLLASAIRNRFALPSGLQDGSKPVSKEASLQRVRALRLRVQEQAIDSESLALFARFDRAREFLESATGSGQPVDPALREKQIVELEALAGQLSQHLEAAIGRLDKAAKDKQRETYRTMLMLLVAAMLLAIAVGLYVGRSITRPMALLEEGAVRVAGGDLTTRIDLDSADEFGRLARQFNRMTSSLQEHRAKLLQSERLAAIGRFAAGVAHEMNNPLGVMLGYLRVMRQTASGQLDEDLAIVEEEAVRCQRIVEGLLDLARPIQGRPRQADLTAIAAEVFALLKGAEESVTTIIDIQGSGVARGNPEKLWQVISNLLRNAYEAAGRDGKIRVRARSIDDGVVVELTVEDDGPGLSKEGPDRLFEPFYSTKPTGTGLGLAVSRAIVQAHGGSLEAGDSDLGGAIFTVRLPAWVEGAA